MKRAIATLILAGAFALAGCGGEEEMPAVAAPGDVVIVTATAQPAAQAAAPAVAEVVTEVGTDPAGTDAAAVAAPSAPADGAAPQGMGPGVSGEVIAVDGATLTVQDMRQGTTVTVVLGDDTQITQQAAVDLASIAVGETVTAMGTQEGNVFTAQRVQVGEAGGFGGGPGGGGPGGITPPGDQLPQGGGQLPPAGDGSGGPPGEMGGAMLSGTVTAASADGLTVTTTTASGETVQIVLGEGGQATQQAQVTAAAITAGVQVRVSGETDGLTVTATRVELMTGMGPQ